MLREALIYLLTPCDSDFRKLGYLREMIATGARYRRCSQYWEHHLAQCHAVIEDASAQTKRRECAVVLGGGMLHDIPLQTLADQFRRLVLIDVCFARWTVRKARQISNVETVVADITGRARGLLRNRIKPVQSISDLPAPEPISDVISDADMVISANVMSQLPLVPIDYLGRRGMLEAPDLEVSLGRTIIEEHMQLLRSSRGVVCLISEDQRMSCNGDVVIETEDADALFGIDPGFNGPSWIWDIAPHPEIYRDRDIRVRVATTIFGG